MVSLIESFVDFDNPWKAIVLMAGAALVVYGIKEACKGTRDVVNTRCKVLADKAVEEYVNKMDIKLEKQKAINTITVKEAQAQAQAEAYEKMRKADAVLYGEKKHIDYVIRQKIRELALQQNASDDQPAEDSSESICSLRTTQDLFNRPNDLPSSWIVDGYAKPGQITLVTAGNSVGKSVLLTQIALAVAKGARPEFLPDTCCVSLKQDVVYYRIEDFSDELEGKYGNGKVLEVANISWVLPQDLKSRTLDGLLGHVKQLARQLEHDTVICIDPATKLDGYRHEACIKGLEEAQRIALERRVTLTPIVAAHLDEINDWKHLSSRDIKGGDKAIQQSGAVIALRKERTVGGEHRFIQCLKEPKGHSMPFSQGVLVCKSVKSQLDKENCYLHFEFVGIKPEKDALPMKPKSNNGKACTSKSVGDNLETEAEKPKKKWLSKEDKETILNDLKKGVKPKDIAKKVGCHVRSVQRVKKNNIA